jgi:hypothetical protein
MEKGKLKLRELNFDKICKRVSANFSLLKPVRLLAMLTNLRMPVTRTKQWCDQYPPQMGTFAERANVVYHSSFAYQGNHLSFFVCRKQTQVCRFHLQLVPFFVYIFNMQLHHTSIYIYIHTYIKIHTYIYIYLSTYMLPLQYIYIFEKRKRQISICFLYIEHIHI